MVYVTSCVPVFDGFINVLSYVNKSGDDMRLFRRYPGHTNGEVSSTGV